LEENGSDYREVSHGTYEVKIEKLELTQTKETKLPMVSCWIRIVEGEYKGSIIFMNQVISQPFQLHIANEFYRSLESGLEVEFNSYSQYGQLLMDIHEAIDGKLEYLLKYEQNNKGFDTFEIVDIYEV